MQNKPSPPLCRVSGGAPFRSSSAQSPPQSTSPQAPPHRPPPRCTCKFEQVTNQVVPTGRQVGRQGTMGSRNSPPTVRTNKSASRSGWRLASSHTRVRALRAARWCPGVTHDVGPVRGSSPVYIGCSLLRQRSGTWSPLKKMISPGVVCTATHSCAAVL